LLFTANRPEVTKISLRPARKNARRHPNYIPLAALQHIEKRAQGLSAQGFDALLQPQVDALLSDI
jgi:hypothetical protein